MRTLLTAAVAVLVTAILFLLMQALIRDDAVVVVEPPPAKTDDPPPIDEPPPGLDGDPVLVETPDHPIDFTDPGPVGPGGGDRTFKVSLSEGNDPIPVITIPPQYPRQQLVNGTEGWVRVAFTIAPDGSVADAAVVDAHPRRGLFDNAALTAIRHWQFRPRQGDDGTPVASRAEYTVEFKLDRGRGG